LRSICEWISLMTSSHWPVKMFDLVCPRGRWRGLRPTSQCHWLESLRVQIALSVILEIPENNKNLGNSYLIHFNSEKCKWYIKLFRKTKSIYLTYNIAYMCEIILNHI
jgi:hypothetical protein